MTIKRGAPMEITDAAGQKWTLGYDPRIRARVETSPTGATTRTVLGDDGRVLAIVDPLGGTTKYEYDAATGLVTSIVRPDGERRTFEYDAAGSLTGERVGSHQIRLVTYHPDGTVATVREY